MATIPATCHQLQLPISNMLHAHPVFYKIIQIMWTAHVYSGFHNFRQRRLPFADDPPMWPPTPHRWQPNLATSPLCSLGSAPRRTLAAFTVVCIFCQKS